MIYFVSTSGAGIDHAAIKIIRTQDEGTAADEATLTGVGPE